MNVIAVLLTGSSDQKILSGFNYWLICWWFSWLISLFFDDLSPDRLCKMIVNMLRQASKPFLIHFPSLICSWFWFWFWLESVELMLFWQSPSCRGRQQPLHWSEARSGGPERRTETRMSSEQSSGTRNQEPGPGLFTDGSHSCRPAWGSGESQECAELQAAGQRQRSSN